MRRVEREWFASAQLIRIVPEVVSMNFKNYASGYASRVCPGVCFTVELPAFSSHETSKPKHNQPETYKWQSQFGLTLPEGDGVFLKLLPSKGSGLSDCLRELLTSLMKSGAGRHQWGQTNGDRVRTLLYWCFPIEKAGAPLQTLGS